MVKFKNLNFSLANYFSVTNLRLLSSDAITGMKTNVRWNEDK